jgi:arylsulfatase A-like enzyme
MPSSTKSIGWVFILIVSAFACTAQIVRARESALDRTALPIAEPRYTPITELDVRKATPPPRFEIKAPDGAPNVLVILLDNLGFGATKPFGGVIEMPTLERLAKEGLIYNNFHTAPLCSPSRVALLTGHNSHSANMGSISETATAFPGQTSERPNSVATLPEILKLNGYSTAMFGKTHEFTPWELGPSGPFESWPTGSGFERFYGTLSGEADLFAPPQLDDVLRIRAQMMLGQNQAKGHPQERTSKDTSQHDPANTRRVH